MWPNMQNFIGRVEFYRGGVGEMDHLESKSFEERRCQYAGDGLGQLFPPVLTM